MAWQEGQDKEEKHTGRLPKLKAVSAIFLLVCFLSLNKSTCQTRKNVYFISKALFVLEKTRKSNFRNLHFQIS